MQQAEQGHADAALGACMRMTLEALPSPVLLIDRNDRILDVNQAFCDLAGQDRSYWLSTPIQAYLSADQIARFTAEHAQVFATGADLETEEVIDGHDGTRRNVVTRRRRILVGETPLVLTILTDITPLRAAEAHIRHLAYHDGLTGLFNRTALNEQLAEALADGAPALLLIDLYQFKDINDAFGDGVGDALLRAFAYRLAGAARGSDRVARTGGDTFAVLIDACPDAAAAETACRRLLALLDAPLVGPSGAVSLGVSIGCAWAEPGLSADELHHRAEFALYEAKRQPANAFCLYDAALADEVHARRTLEADLRAALATGGQLDVHYQPVIDAGGHRVVGVEALVRWHHPQQGMIPPLHFIPIAEASGLIVPLGEWVLDRAVAMMVRFPALALAVNLSPIQLRSPDIDTRILAVLARHGMDPRQLQLEVTESTMLAMDAGVELVLARLREAGVQLVLDDFGTGYSSLSHLHKLAVDRVKIDQSFVRDLARSQDARAIIQAVLGIGQSLGIGVTAEGVEDELQQSFLRSFGCHEYQGYLFSRPLPATEAAAFLEAHTERAAA
ncbi:PAS domain S-box-containing protein/diguanylate cyclase (GGDEF) domain-containing protein [Sphingomonas sp. NFR04]|uniref:putative bifunctional diguanylate cyclase/phosphodiesterase n=1 Tax=Sphingomonas sp. NFR04 TaxID=1566283 RepID=UPI0008E05695|nr:GGDEF domain-containing protein [Sphingomonas sp. NFR04]SFK02909.1 PAS domain S-box-containing protein/diguanylate cyclase (GGDEF) domain-containing protein [Sphingomonas sp. NFR04]